MKCKIVLLIILFPLFALAQNKETIDSLAKSKLYDLVDSWSLGISDSADLDIEVYNKFKILFDSSATIEDDLNVFYEYMGPKKPGVYRASGKSEPFDIYAHDVALAVQIKSIGFDSGSIVPINPNIKDPTERIFRLSRNIDFQKTGRYVLPDTYADAVTKSRSIEPKTDSSNRDFLLDAGIKKNEDSVYKFISKEVWLVTMAFNAGTNTIAITSIQISSETACTNDADNDAVIDNQDSLPKTPGDFTANGRPDYDLDGIADRDDKCLTTYGTVINKGCPIEYFYTKSAFDVFLGGQFNSAKINLPEPNQLGYNAVETDASLWRKGSLKNPAQQLGIQAGGNFIHYFGKRKKKAGISVGFYYAGFNAGYDVDSAHGMIYTFKSSDGTNDYRRQIKFDSLHEDINYNVFSLPVLFNYRWHPGRKNNSVIKLQAGPSLMLFRNTSNYTAKIDFGGIYQIDTVGPENAIAYYDYFNPSSKYNVFITSDSINAQNSNPGAGNVFQQLKNAGDYDFASNNNYKDNPKLHRIAVAFNIGLDLQQKISEGLTIKVGANFVYAPLFERNKKYIPIDKTTDPFQSIYYSTAKSYYSTYGVNLGLVYNW